MRQCSRCLPTNAWPLQTYPPPFRPPYSPRTGQQYARNEEGWRWKEAAKAGGMESARHAKSIGALSAGRRSGLRFFAAPARPLLR